MRDITNCSSLSVDLSKTSYELDGHVSEVDDDDDGDVDLDGDADVYDDQNISLNLIEQAQLNLNKINITKTNRNSKKLCHEGFYYTLDRETEVKMQWKCERTGSKNIPKCHGRVHTLINSGPVIVITEHNNHLPILEREDCLKSLASMLEKANISSDNPKSIMKRHQFDLNIESAPYMFRASSIRQRIQRIRNIGFFS